MAKLTVRSGSASRSEYIFINDSTSTSGVGLTGLVFNSAGLSAYYVTERGTATAISLVTLASATATYSSGGFVAVDATNMPGLYRLDIPSAVFASTKGIVMLKGATNMVPVLLEYDVVSYDPTDTVRLGLTAIPNVAQGTTGAISTGNATGQVTVATNNDKTNYALSGTQTFNVTGNITGNVSGSVGSVTGAVGSVTGAVGSVTGNVGGNVTGSVGSLTATAVQNIWDDATANNTVVGSIGKLVVDNLDATVSSRSTLTAANVWTTDVSAFVTAGQAGTFQKNTDALTSSRMATFTYTAPLTASATASAVWDALLASYTVANSFGQRVLRGSTAQAACAVTGSNHIAADIHELQPAVITSVDFAANAIDANALATSAVTEIQTGLATSAAVATVSAVTDKLNTAMQLDGAVYQFTVNALELAPSGGGGGGSSTIVVNGPYNAIADGLGASDALDIQQSTAQDVAVRCVDANGSGVSLTGATVSAKVYNSAGTLVATYGGTITYAADGWLTFGLTTAVTNTVGTYTITITRTTSATDTSIYGPLRMYVRGI
jgi:hypothetical protein